VRWELSAAISQRYQTADRQSKKLILDEFTNVTGYHRKYANRIPSTWPTTSRQPRATHRVYREAVQEALIVLWEAADRICGERLKALLPQLVEAMERHKHLQLEQEASARLFAVLFGVILG
jgi:hypothetical protein